MAIKKVRIKNGTPIDVNDARINGIDSTPTLNSTNVVTSGGVKSALDGITEKIPAQASSTNQLADKAFVNSSIETATADFKGTFNSLAELEEVTANKNDYGFVISTDASGNTVYNRYKYNGTEWLFEYSLNNSSFTAAQWAAIQSGITSALVTKLNGIADGAEVNVQSDWNAESGDAFIKNKPQNLVQDAGYVHTDNNYTTTEKNKLSGIESGAQKNAAGTVVDANYVHTDNNYTDAEKTKLSGISSGAEVNVLNGVKVNGVEQTATEKKVDISVPTSLSQLSDDASHRVVSDSEKSAWSGKYNKPSGGIPESDLSTSVQSSLSKADTALQAESDPTVPAWAKAASKPSYSYSEISDKPTLGTAAAKDVPSSGDASATQVVIGNDSRLSDSRPASDVSDWAKAGTKPTYTKGEVGLGNVTNDAQVKRTEMGAASGVATLGSDGKVPASQLPSYVDDVLEYANRQAFPETGESGKIYVALDTNKTFRWSGSAYVEISPSLVIGTTTGTAYDGGSGQALADKLSGIENGAQVNVLDGVKVNGVAQTITDKKVDISVPTALSQLSADATHRVVTDSEKTAWGNKYDKPSGGIPKSDLASDVQTSLGKADTAIQSHQDISGKANKSEMAVSASGDKTTITLKTGTSATVLNAHQDISGKVDKVSGKGLSTNDYTTDEKNKLSGIASGAQVNVIETVKVNGTALTPSSKAVDVSVPTKVSQLTNDSGYTTNVGTITGITMNGASKGTSGVVNLGTVITSHQDISGKEDKSNKVTTISSSSTDTQYPSAKAVYTGLAAKQNKAYVNNNTLYL